MNENNLFQKLFIFELANNHMGSLEHGKKTIAAFAGVAKDFAYRFAFKFQFRHLETFIHPHYHNRSDMKYIKRFRETALTHNDFSTLSRMVKDNGFISMSTAFDEPSVDLIEELGIEILKIASCSFTDWPLLERIVLTDLPIIVSTAGATLEDIDKVISFLQHRNKQFAVMHCVGEYPTKAENLQLNQIDLLKNRYPGVPIGFSTHEDPENTTAIAIAIAKGAHLFERHIAVETTEFPKNNYSSTPEQIRRWLEAAEVAYQMCGADHGRPAATLRELADLQQFKRGVYAKKKITAGERIDLDNIFLAFPNSEGQVLANDISKYSEFYAETEIPEHAPIMEKLVRHVDPREKIYAIVQRVKQLLLQGSVVVPGKAELEISHHYGIDRFEEAGCTIINVINREYCKKLIVVLPGQSHPEQHHKVKEETFVVLHGDIVLTLDGSPKALHRGDVVTVDRGVKHIFSSVSGGVIEEISSTHFKDDSFYTDPAILQNKHRKTVLTYWMT